MTGSAKKWWRDYTLTRVVVSPTLTWEQFSRLFLEKFLPITLREDYRMQFERLQQGSMTVTQYETRFMDLARHTLLLLPTEGERVRRFIKEPTHPIRLQMAKDTGSDISFQAAANVARRIEMVLAQERGQGYDKKPHQFGRFSGSSSGGRGNFGRVHPPRPFHSALQASHSASGGHGHYMSHSDQLAYSAPPVPINAPPIRGDQSGYPGRHGQFKGQQSQQPKTCYTCGDLRHITRFFPRASAIGQFTAAGFPCYDSCTTCSATRPTS
ncbi:uncharacterized protein [Nicotiana tomentosiformis]|uniref:uncharacterized protein n=1 Tax=Nicotiana tomentosiformis TaxID=4098 RepID=UPI00388C6955